jgi:translation initiation factor IF-3
MAKPYIPRDGNRRDNPKNMQNQIAANERIRVPQVRLISSDGTNVGVVGTREALFQAQQQGLDLVVINNQANPVVAKILDLNKWLYEQKLAEKERARKSRESEIQLKEVQLRPVTDEHDISIKARNAAGFLKDNCKVKVVIKFRGREMAYQSLGFDVMHRFLAAVGEHRLEKEPILQGNSISTILLPPK